MKIKIEEGSSGNHLMVVVFEDDSNFNSEDLTWVPTMREVKRIYRRLKSLQK